MRRTSWRSHLVSRRLNRAKFSPSDPLNWFFPSAAVREDVPAVRQAAKARGLPGAVPQGGHLQGQLWRAGQLSRGGAAAGGRVQRGHAARLHLLGNAGAVNGPFCLKKKRNSSEHLDFRYFDLVSVPVSLSHRVAPPCVPSLPLLRHEERKGFFFLFVLFIGMLWYVCPPQVEAQVCRYINQNVLKYFEMRLNCAGSKQLIPL